jgi:TRAP-type C4-dicarboxylate transport system substrate-binding protein
MLTGALAAGASTVITAPSIVRAEPEVVWRVQSHWPSSSTSFIDSLIVTRDTLAQRTGGRFQLELFGSGELFKGPEIFSAVHSGVVEMGTILASYIDNDVASAGIVGGMPGTFQRVSEFSRFLKNIGAEQLFADELLRKHGVMYMSERSYASELVLKRPVRDLADFEALTISSTGSTAIYLMEGGAKTVPTPAGELYEALQSGRVDGAHWGAAQGAYSLKLYEFAKYHVRPPLNINADGYIFSKAAFDALPKQFQQMLVLTLDGRYWRRTAESERNEEATLQKVVSELGVQVIQFPDDVKAGLRNAAKLLLQVERGKGGAAAEGMARMDKLLAELGYA